MIQLKINFKFESFLTPARTETPVQFTDGHGIPRGPSMASDVPSLIMEKFRRKKLVQVEIWHVYVMYTKNKVIQLCYFCKN